MYDMHIYKNNSNQTRAVTILDSNYAPSGNLVFVVFTIKLLFDGALVFILLLFLFFLLVWGLHYGGMECMGEWLVVLWIVHAHAPGM